MVRSIQAFCKLKRSIIQRLHSILIYGSCKKNTSISWKESYKFLTSCQEEFLLGGHIPSSLISAHPISGSIDSVVDRRGLQGQQKPVKADMAIYSPVNGVSG